MSDYYPSDETVMAALPLFAAARRTDPPTSQASGSNAATFKGSHERAILDALAAGPGTKDQLAGRIGWLDQQQVARRMSKLVERGLVLEAGESVSPSGNRETVYSNTAASL